MDITDYDAVLRHVAAGIHPDKAILSTGPADELEHASPDPVFGGKLMLDMSKPADDASIQPVFEKSQLRYGNLLIRYRKTGDEESDSHISDDVTCIVDVDFPIERDAVNLLLWWILANTDPKRDIRVRGNALHVDARVKAGKKNVKRRWPQPVVSSDDVIKATDSKWEGLGIGKFLPSPSKKIKRFVKSDGAAVKND